MSQPKFNGKVVLNSAVSGTPGEWTVQATFNDLSGTYLATDIAVNDIIVLDTGNFAPGTVTRYTITAVSNQTSDTFDATIQYHAFNDNLSEPDLSYVIGVPGFVARLSDLKDLSAIPATSVQLLPDLLTAATYNDDTFNIVDKINGSTNLAVTVGATDVQVLSDTGNDATIPAATTTEAGVMTAADKTKLDGIPADAISASRIGAANGVAALDASGFIPMSQLPATAITDTFVVASEAEMLALVAQTGDVAVRTDLTKSFILRGTDPTVLSDWQELLTPPNSVLSVNGQTGIVVITDITGNAGTATAIAGGTAGAVMYQSGAGVTEFVAAGTSGQVLQSTGTGAPQWVDLPPGVTDLAIANVTTTTVDVTSSTGADATIPSATTTAAGVMTADDKTKLDGIAAGATANQTDAYLLDRVNHTGVQAIATIDGLQAALDSKAAAVHTHIITDVTGLQAALDAKQDTLTAGTNITITSGVIAAAGTNLSTTLSATDVQVLSDTGNDATIPAATTTEAGVMTAADKTKLDGIAAGATANQTDAYLLDRTNHTGVQAINTIADLQTTLDAKAPLTHTHAIADVTDLQTTLDGKQALLTAGANIVITAGGEISATVAPTDLAIANVTTTTVDITSSTGADATIPAATTTEAGVMTAADKTKLDGIAAGATANQTDAYLLDRANHTGVQAISTVDGLQAALDAKQDTLTAGTNITITSGVIAAAATDLSVAPSATEVVVNSSTGTDTAIPAATTTEAGVMTAADKTKLDGIAAGATANQTDAYLLDRTNHTGVQAISTVDGLQTALDGKAAAVHTHAIADVTDLQTTLDAKAALTHTHAIADVTGLQAALDAKQDTLTAGTNITITSGVIAAAATDLTAVPSATEVVVNSSTGTDTAIPAATTTEAGVMTAADKTKLDSLSPVTQATFVQAKKTVTNNSVTCYIQIIGFGQQSDVDNVTVTLTGGNTFELGNIANGLQLQGVSAIYGANFNSTNAIAFRYPEPYGGTVATELYFPMLHHFNDGTPSVIQATTAINYSITGGVVQMQKTGLVANVPARFRLQII